LPGGATDGGGGRLLGLGGVREGVREASLPKAINYLKEYWKNQRIRAAEIEIREDAGAWKLYTGCWNCSIGDFEGGAGRPAHACICIL
jgi:hypothetical protein